MKIYLKLFLATAIPFGLLMTLIYQHPGLGALTGLLFGFAMSLTQGTIHLLSTRKKGFKNSSETTKVKQKKTLELELFYDETFDRCLESLDTIKGTIRYEDRVLGKIIAKTGLSWRSYGETLHFTVQKIENEITQVQISSKPTWSIALVDYGKNFENIKAISTFLEKRR